MDNSIMEALAAVDLPVREFRVVMAIAGQIIGSGSVAFPVATLRQVSAALSGGANLRRKC